MTVHKSLAQGSGPLVPLIHRVTTGPAVLADKIPAVPTVGTVGGTLPQVRNVLTNGVGTREITPAFPKIDSRMTVLRLPRRLTAQTIITGLGLPPQGNPTVSTAKFCWSDNDRVDASSVAALITE